MLFGAPLPFVKAFVDQIDEAIEQHQPQARLSTAQRAWLSFCIMAVLICNAVCWAQFERASLGAYSVSALSWMFRHSKIPWDLLLPMSTRVILRRHGLHTGVLVLDDSDKRRSKTTKRIAHVHKVKDKATGGYFRGQTLVFLVLVTDKLTLPVGFAFYQPDPVLSAWYKQQKRLKKQGVPPKQRPAKPHRRPPIRRSWNWPWVCWRTSSTIILASTSGRCWLTRSTAPARFSTKRRRCLIGRR